MDHAFVLEPVDGGDVRVIQGPFTDRGSDLVDAEARTGEGPNGRKYSGMGSAGMHGCIRGSAWNDEHRTPNFERRTIIS
jgi:hypothetical protein